MIFKLKLLQDRDGRKSTISESYNRDFHQIGDSAIGLLSSVMTTRSWPKEWNCGCKQWKWGFLWRVAGRHKLASTSREMQLHVGLTPSAAVVTGLFSAIDSSCALPAFFHSSVWIYPWEHNNHPLNVRIQQDAFDTGREGTYEDMEKRQGHKLVSLRCRLCKDSLLKSESHRHEPLELVRYLTGMSRGHALGELFQVNDPGLNGEIRSAVRVGNDSHEL